MWKVRDMRAQRGVWSIAMAAVLTLAACGGGNDGLMNLRSEGDGPDEFSILPAKPLEMPATLVDLPTPTPGGANRTDQNPQADAVVALGGRPGAGAAGDAALVAQTTRYGVAPDIRTTLASEDAEFRRRNRGKLLERLFGQTVYYSAYAPVSLDQATELERWRAAGARTSAAPPPSEN